MKCDEFELVLNEEFPRDATGELAAHAAECRSCRALWDSHRVLGDAIVAWRAELPDADLTSAVLKTWQTERQKTDRASTTVVRAPQVAASRNGRPDHVEFRRSAVGSRGALMALVAGLAALIALSTIPGLWNLGPAEKQPVAVRPAEKTNPTPTAPIARRQSTKPAREEAQTSYYVLAQKAVGALGEVAVLVLPAHPSKSPMPAPEMPAASQSDWLEGLQNQIQPIGRSLGDAFDFLWQAGESQDGTKT